MSSYDNGVYPAQRAQQALEPGPVADAAQHGRVLALAGRVQAHPSYDKSIRIESNRIESNQNWIVLTRT